jgi:tetratricopeptide (TPR) repeat protein
MKSKKRKSDSRQAAAVMPVTPARSGALYWVLAALGAFVAALIAYWPALRGEFVFDDMMLPFTAVEFSNAPLLHWVAGTRPVLMLSFWANYAVSGLEPMPYHFMNVVLHAAAAIFVFLVVRQILANAGESGTRREWLAGFAAGVFLLHPIQTESVAYVASRSEVLSVSLFYAAFGLFLYRRRNGIGWLDSIAVLTLFGAAVTTKEHAAVLPALLLLTDYYWNPPFSFAGIRRNWRLYSLTVAGATAASMWVLRVLRESDTAGLQLKEANWYEYLLTQGREIWLYLRLFLFPFGLNVDHDVPFSRGPLDGGAIFGLAALLGVAIAAIVYRKRYPLASYGMLMFFLLIAPTSSFIPIMDPVAERRMYLPIVGLLFVVLEAVRRLAVRRRETAWACAAVCLVLLVATNARSQVWSAAVPLWEDAVSKSPRKYRPHFQLAFAYQSQGRCADAIRHYNAAGEVARSPQYNLFLDWALAYDCLGDQSKGIEKLERALQIMPNAHVYSIMGMLYGKQGKSKEALAALDTAIQLDPNFQPAWVYRGAVYGSSSQFEKAVEAYRQALALNPNDEGARRGLALVQAQLRGR